MSQAQENLNFQEEMLRRAKEGDEAAIEWNRDLIRQSADKAPVNDMLEIADFLTDFLRRYIKNYIQNN